MGKKKNQNKTKKNENKNVLPSAPEPPAQPRDRSPSPIHEPIEVVDTAGVLLQHASFNKRAPSHPNNSNTSYNNASTSGLTSSPQQQKSTPTVSPGNVTRYKSFSGELSSNVRQFQQQQNDDDDDDEQQQQHQQHALFGSALRHVQSAPDLGHHYHSPSGGSAASYDSAEDSLSNFGIVENHTYLLTPIDPTQAVETVARNPGSTVVCASKKRSPVVPNNNQSYPNTPSNTIKKSNNNKPTSVSDLSSKKTSNTTTTPSTSPLSQQQNQNQQKQSSAEQLLPPRTMTKKHHQHHHHQQRTHSPVFNKNIEGHFVPIFNLSSSTKDNHHNDQHPEGTEAASNVNKLVRLFGGLVLISKIQWQNVLMWLASYQYIPLMAAVCVTTANALLAVAAAAVLPVIEYVSDDNFLNADQLSTTATTADSNNIGDEANSTGVLNLTTRILRSGVGLVLGSLAAMSDGDHDASSVNNNNNGEAATSVEYSSSSSLTHFYDSVSLARVLTASSVSFLITLGTAVCGYKVASMVGDAFLDSCRVVVDRRTHYTLPFYSLYCDICRIFNLGPRYVTIFVVFLFALPAVILWSVLGGRYGIDKRPAFVAAFFATVFEVSWIIFQTVRFVMNRTLQSAQHPPTSDQESGDSTSVATTTTKKKNNSSLHKKQQQFQIPKRRTNRIPGGVEESSSEAVSRSSTDRDDDDDDDEDESEEDFNPNFDSATANATATQLARELGVWWARKIPKVRRRGFFILFVTAILITLGSGLLHGLIAMVEGFLYVSFVHLVAHVAARSTLFFRALHLAVRTLFKDAAAAIVALIIGPLLLGITITNYFRFGFYLAIIQVPVLILATISVASHARDLKDLRVSNPGKHSKKRESILSSISFVFWRVVLMNARKSYDYGAHWKVAQYIRVVMRAVISLFCLVVVALSSWVAIQSIQFRYEGYKSKMLQARNVLDENNNTLPDQIEVYAPSFSMFMKGGKHHSPATEKKTATSSSSYAEKYHTSLSYRGMCQRRWFSASEDEHDNDNDNDSDEDATSSSSSTLLDTKKDLEDSLFFGDLAFFSMLAYVPNIASTKKNEENHFTQLFNFYRKHRRGGAKWELMDQARDVWEELRKLPSMKEDFGVDIEKERREIIRWSQLHLVESLRPPFYHFRRNRTTIITKHKNDDGDDHPKKEQEEDEQSFAGYDNLFVARGTEMAFAADFWQNVVIFADVFLVEQLAHFVPGVGLLPIEFIRDLVSATNFIARTPAAFFYHTHILKYMRATQLLNMYRNKKIEKEFASANKMTNKRKTILQDRNVGAGHSLGGVVVQLAGPQLKIPAVAFSAPGTVYMSRKFGVSADATEGFVTNMVVSNDLIPLIGTVNGEVHNVLCEHDGSLICHSVQLSFWRLMTKCGLMRKVFDVDVSYKRRQSQMVLFLHQMNSWLESIIGMTLSFEKFV